MKLKILTSTVFALLVSLCTSAAAGPPVELKPGMVIKTSVIIKKAAYRFNGSASLDTAVILIEGNNITVDFNHCSLTGSNDKEMPNEFYGLAIRVKGDHITLKNLAVSGYKVAIMATGCTGLVIEQCDASYNYRQHLQSTWQREDVSDWMSYHHNEQSEWLRYGAGIYLVDCSRSSIRNNRITGGQCALMMTRCNDGLIEGNDFSFNSALGIGMYRSSRNRVLNNRLNFNVRGHSEGFYNRGQDSAGLLVFEQCNDNTFAYNSVTHGGDGFFLWAGQTTMDTGEGGCNGNLLYENDFSYAPTNGVELTFSRNRIVHNRIVECDHGVWGGYSYQTDILDNTFENNRIAIAIEHGQHNAISYNRFTHNKEGIRLWANRKQPPDWIYAQKRDTRSMHYTIYGNAFTDEALCCNIKLTDTVQGAHNSMTRVGQFLRADTTDKHIALDSSNGNGEAVANHSADPREQVLKQLNGSKRPEPDSVLAGRKHIRITEWGPYDYRYPLVFLKKIDSNQVAYFDVLGPKGEWTLVDAKGLSAISLDKGSFPASLTARLTGPDRQLKLAYSGKAFTDAFGKKQPAGKNYPFEFRDFDPGVNWTVSWYAWDSLQDPNKDYSRFTRIFEKPALKTEQTKRPDYTWWGKIGEGLPADSFATVATCTMELAKGRYRLGVTADDLVKVYIDGKPVIDFWDASLYKYDEDAHHAVILELGGTHQFRIEQVENSGFSTLQFYLKPL